MSRTISAGNSPRIKVDTIGGDLSIVGWDGADILVKGDDEEIRLEQNGEEVSLSCGGDLSLRVPKESSFEFETIGGDGSIRGVQGNIELREIAGDLSVRDVNSIAIGTVRADFSLRGAKGNLYVKNAQGDVSVRDVDGNISLDSIANDLALRGARGNIRVNVGADVIIYLDPKPDGSYAVVAGDDVLLVLPPNANATLSMQGDRIEFDWPDIEPDEDATERVVVLGNGSAKISLSAGGDVRVSNRADAGEFAQEFGNFAGLNFDWSGFGERISRQVERATAQAARRAEEAARRAERHAERHARKWKANVNVGRWNWDLGPKGVPTPSVPSSEPVAEEERLAILKMLAEKKITAAQAEELLKALEGGK
ncbi:MAG: hypothetical protein C3F07_07275 [Anaerolineales bacterium]|nr:hypothetical protein [Anaerolineae bacterium]PWB74526.1 MAG: hypothetical protein C3F07_07275 [Anaerolineales bacterium]